MSNPGPDSRRAVARIVAALVTVAVAIVGLGTAPARAHTEVDFTLPVEGAAVGEPVFEVSVGFTRPVTLIGPGFEVLDPQGNVVIPSVVTDDDQVFRLQLDPPLAGGEAAVRWEVRAEDGHTITGGFAFAISVEALTTTSLPVPGPAEGATPATTTTTTTATSPVSSTIAAPAAPGTDDSTPTVPDSEVPSETVDPPSEVDPNGSSGMYFALGGVVVIAAAAFVAIRSRVSAST